MSSTSIMSLDSVFVNITNHNNFFGKIIDIIPKDLYKPKEESEESLASQKYYKHRKQPLAIDEKKANRKSKLNEKYSSTEVSEEALQTDAPSAIVSSVSEKPVVEEIQNNANSEEPGNYKTLREKMQERIKMLQNERISLKPHKQQQAVRTKEVKKEKQQHKDRSTQRKEVSHEERSRAVMSALLQSSTSVPVTSSSNDVVETSAEGTVIEYGTIQNLDCNASSKGDNLAGKSGAKMLRLKRMLEEAENKRKRLNELKSEAYNNVIKQGSGVNDAKTETDNGYSFGNNVALNKLRAEQWSDAMKDASGGTGSIDTEKIKKAIKRMEKKKEKSSVQWQDRLENQKNALQDRLSKREAHISARKKGIDVATVKPETAANGKDAGLPPAKRPRLFMAMKHKDSGGGDDSNGANSSNKQNRAGFEGKKQGYLNKPPKSK